MDDWQAEHICILVIFSLAYGDMKLCKGVGVARGYRLSRIFLSAALCCFVVLLTYLETERHRRAERERERELRGCRSIRKTEREAILGEKERNK